MKMNIEQVTMITNITIGFFFFSIMMIIPILYLIKTGAI